MEAKGIGSRGMLENSIRRVHYLKIYTTYMYISPISREVSKQQGGKSRESGRIFMVSSLNFASRFHFSLKYST